MAGLPRILLVDDDVDFVAATRSVLEAVPYDVVTASTGEEGLTKARETMPDLVILDVIMPVRDGFTVAEQLKKDPQLKQIPVIMLTAFSQTRSSIPRSRGFSLETEDYLEKPVPPAALLQAVKRYLKK